MRKSKHRRGPAGSAAAVAVASAARGDGCCGKALVMESEEVHQTIAKIEAELAKIEPLKKQMRRTLQAAVSKDTKQSLQGCRLEVVGSSSWGGDVPQSDLDVVLLTVDGCAVGRQAVEALKDLRSSLEAVLSSMPPDPGGSSQENSAYAKLEHVVLLETAHPPILRLRTAEGLDCDVSVDQHHALAHRNMLRHLLKRRPKARELVRLVKYWLRLRGLPVAAEGGLPSLAWAMMAMRFARTRSEHTPAATLLRDFFEELQHLGERALCLRRCPQHAVGTHFEWRPRGDSTTAWSDEWVELVSVEDPVAFAHQAPGSKPQCTITAPSMPAALGLLYITDLRLARAAIRTERWSDLWKSPIQAAPALDRLMIDRELHVVLKDGQVFVGKLIDVQYCAGVVRGDVLHRRDQSSRLCLQVCELRRESPSLCLPENFIFAEERDEIVECQPCHWVCALPFGSHMELLSEGLSRLAEIVQVVGITRVSQSLLDVVLAWRRAISVLSTEPTDKAAAEMHNSDAPGIKETRPRGRPISLKHCLEVPDACSDEADDSTCISARDSELQDASGVASISSEAVSSQVGNCQYFDIGGESITPASEASSTWKPRLYSSCHRIDPQRHVVPSMPSSLENVNVQCPESQASLPCVLASAAEDATDTQKPSAANWRPMLRHKASAAACQ